MRGDTYAGEPCRRCSNVERYANTRRCVACQKRAQHEYNQTPEGKKYKKTRYFEVLAYYKTERGRLSLRVNSQKTRAKRKLAEGSYTTQEWINLKSRYRCCCLCCGRHESELDGPLEQDHVVPISKGGTNWITNIQPLCEDCNGMGGKGIKIIDYRN